MARPVLGAPFFGRDLAVSPAILRDALPPGGACADPGLSAGYVGRKGKSKY